MVRVLARNTLICIVLALAAVLTSPAQVTTADVVGRVTDATGAVLHGIRVTIENLSTQAVRSTQTTTSGDYVLSLLPPGPYSLRIEATGFKTSVLPELALAAGDRARADVQMQIGEMQAETVQVFEFQLHVGT